VPILLGALLCKFHNQHFAVNILQVLQSTHDSHNSTCGRPRISDQPDACCWLEGVLFLCRRARNASNLLPMLALIRV